MEETSRRGIKVDTDLAIQRRIGISIRLDLRGYQGSGDVYVNSLLLTRASRVVPISLWLWSTDFTHHECPKKKSLMVCDISRVFFYVPMQHEIYVELCEEAKKTVEDNSMCAKVRTRKFNKWWPLSVTQLVRLRPLFCHHQRSFEMSCARRRFRCARRTSGPGLDEKRVGVEAGNQHYNSWDGPGMSR